MARITRWYVVKGRVEPDLMFLASSPKPATWLPLLNVVVIGPHTPAQHIGRKIMLYTMGPNGSKLYDMLYPKED